MYGLIGECLSTLLSSTTLLASVQPVGIARKRTAKFRLPLFAHPVASLSWQM
jgi:hypothetical protein